MLNHPGTLFKAEQSIGYNLTKGDHYEDKGSNGNAGNHEDWIMNIQSEWRDIMLSDFIVRLCVKFGVGLIAFTNLCHMLILPL